MAARKRWSPPVASPLFSSSVHLQESNVGDAIDAVQVEMEYRRQRGPGGHGQASDGLQAPALTHLERTFRHSGWEGRRTAIAGWIRAVQGDGGRLRRFCQCGAGCIVQRSPSENRIRLAAFYCHDRFCVPCMNARARLIARRLAELCKGKTVRFVTLTLRQDGRSLSARIDRLRKAFRRLKASDRWKENVKGGAEFLEVKWSSNDLGWHPHLHLIVEGCFYDHADLSADWFEATGDSTVVDIQSIDNESHLRHYVTKYVTKGVDASVSVHDQRFLECMSALRGRRLCGLFGSWRGANLASECDGPGDWTYVDALDNVILAAKRGEPGACALMHRLLLASGREFADTA